MSTFDLFRSWMRKQLPQNCGVGPEIEVGRSSSSRSPRNALRGVALTRSSHHSENRGRASRPGGPKAPRPGRRGQKVALLRNQARAGARGFAFAAPGDRVCRVHARPPGAYRPQVGYADRPARWGGPPGSWPTDGRAFHWGGDATFLADLPNGTYKVTPCWEAPRQAAARGHLASGEQVGTGSPGAGKVRRPTYSVTVTDGKLELASPR
jgi:hypothetical protein